MQILSSVLEMIPSSSAIRLAVLASRKELVDLEKWLGNNLTAYKDFFFEVLLLLVPFLFFFFFFLLIVLFLKYLVRIVWQTS